VPKTGSRSSTDGQMTSPRGISTRRALKLLPLGALLTLVVSGGLPCHWAGAPVASAQALSDEAFTEVAAAAGEVRTPELRVVLSEWSLTPAQINVPVGRTIRFLAVNSGILPHALAVEGADLYAESDVVGAGQSVPLDVTFSEPGTYDVFCPVNAGQHRALGQEGIVNALLALPSHVFLPRAGAPAGAFAG
jgi:plastocyanin